MSNDKQIHRHVGDDDDDQVGYGKPPRHSQFKRGQSGNPRGRKPRLAYEEDDFPIRRFMMEPIDVKLNGKKERLTTLEAILMKQAAKALAGDNRSAKLLFEYSGGLKDFRADWKRQKTEAGRKMVDEILKIANTWKFGTDDKKTGGS